MLQYKEKIIKDILNDIAEKDASGAEFDYHDVPMIEDILSVYDVFYNGISGIPCHCDSYMTCVDFDKLGKFIKENKINQKLLDVAFDYWKDNPSVGTALKIAAMEWKRVINHEKQFKQN